MDEYERKGDRKVSKNAISTQYTNSHEVAIEFSRRRNREQSTSKTCLRGHIKSQDKADNE